MSWFRKTKQQPAPATAISIIDAARNNMVKNRDFHGDRMRYYENIVNDAHHKMAQHETAFNALSAALRVIPDASTPGLFDDDEFATAMADASIAETATALTDELHTLPMYCIGETVRDLDGTMRILDTQEKVDAENARWVIAKPDPNEAIAAELAKLQPPAPHPIPMHQADTPGVDEAPRRIRKLTPKQAVREHVEISGLPEVTDRKAQ